MLFRRAAFTAASVATAVAIDTAYNSNTFIPNKSTDTRTTGKRVASTVYIIFGVVEDENRWGEEVII
jgi:hypothetical protein